MLLRNIVNREELKRRMDADVRPYSTISFYCYHPIEDPMAFRNDLFLRFSRLEVVGRIYIALEGINAQLALPVEHFEAFKSDLYTIDLRVRNSTVKPRRDTIFLLRYVWID